MKRFSLILCASFISIAGTATNAQVLKGIKKPANIPPAEYTGQNFVDNNGCIFLRAGRLGVVNWVPLVDTGRRHVCSKEFTPTFAKAPVLVAEAEAPKASKPKAAEPKTVAKPKKTAAAKPKKKAVAKPKKSAPTKAKPKAAAKVAKPVLSDAELAKLQRQYEAGKLTPAQAKELEQKKAAKAKAKRPTFAERVAAQNAAAKKERAQKAAARAKAKQDAAALKRANAEKAQQKKVAAQAAKAKSDKAKAAKDAKAQAAAQKAAEAQEAKKLAADKAAAADAEKVAAAKKLADEKAKAAAAKAAAAPVFAAGYYVQMPVITNAATSKNLAAVFRQSGHKTKEVSQKNGIQVFVGPFRSSSNAKAAFYQARSMGYKNPVIVRK